MIDFDGFYILLTATVYLGLIYLALSWIPNRIKKLG